MNNPFYITFSEDKKSPYGLGEFVVVYGKDIKDASENYRKIHPNVEKDHYNFAFIYNESSWENNISQFYNGKEPSEIIGGKTEEKDSPNKIYIIEDNYGACGYATSEEMANELVSILQGKENDSEFSIYSTLVNQIASKDLVTSFHKENKSFCDTQEEIEL